MLQLECCSQFDSLPQTHIFAVDHGVEKGTITCVASFLCFFSLSLPTSVPSLHPFRIAHVCSSARVTYAHHRSTPSVRCLPSPLLRRYTQWLNKDSRLEADLTVNKMDVPSDTNSEARFLVVATDTMHRHTETHMRRRIADDGARAVVTDVSGAYAQINLQGPRSRALLADLTSGDVSDAAFPFRASRDIDIGFARVQCARITCVEASSSCGRTSMASFAWLRTDEIAHQH